MTLKVKAEQGWQVVGTVGLEEGNPESPVMPCSDFKMSRPTLLLMGMCSNLFGLIIVLFSVLFKC